MAQRAPTTGILFVKLSYWMLGVQFYIQWISVSGGCELYYLQLVVTSFPQRGTNISPNSTRRRYYYIVTGAIPDARCSTVSITLTMMARLLSLLLRLNAIGCCVSCNKLSDELMRSCYVKLPIVTYAQVAPLQSSNKFVLHAETRNTNENYYIYLITIRYT